MSGIAGLLPGQRGPKGGHKLSEAVTAFAAKLKADNPEMTAAQRIDAIKSRFGIEVHRRSLERALARKKKRLE
jgi:transposase